MQRTGAILWLSVLDLARVAADEPVAFDSDNTKQFATKEGTLRPELRAEAIAAGVRVTLRHSARSSSLSQSPWQL